MSSPERPEQETNPSTGEPLAGPANAAWELIRRIHLGTRRPSNWIQLFQFVVVGGSGYVINLAVFTVLTQAADLHHIPAAVGAFAVAVTNNFLLNRQWTFRGQGAREDHAGFQAARFFAVSLAGLGVNLLVLTILVDLAEISELPAQAVAVAFATPVNFVGNKMWTFGTERLGS